MVMVVNDSKTNPYYNFGDCHLDVSKRRLLKKDKPIDLAQKTFDVLCFLVENHGEILRKEQFLEKFWDGEFLEEGILTQQIYKIRKAIKNENTGENYIETVNKVGYRFVGEVTEVIDLQDDLVVETLEQKTTKHIIDKSDISLESLTDYGESVEHFNLKTGLFSLQKKSLGFLVLGLLVLSLISYYYLFSANYSKGQYRLSHIQSIAVLPFEQIGENDNKQLELGLADTLISKFINQKKIDVPSTSSILKFSDKDRENIVEIGKKLEVDAVLTGTIQSEMGTARVNVQLIDVKRGIPIWANKFDTDFTDTFSLQDEVSRQILMKIPIEFSVQSYEYTIRR